MHAPRKQPDDLDKSLVDIDGVALWFSWPWL